MRSSLVLKSVLFCVLFNGAAIATAQAANLTREINRMGDACQAYGPKAGMTAAEQGGAPSTVANGPERFAFPPPKHPRQKTIDAVRHASTLVD